VTVSGHIDIVSSDEFRDALRAARQRSCEGILLDLSRVSHFDAAGVAVLVDCAQNLAGTDVRFAMVPSVAVRDALSILQLEDLFRPYDDLSEALRDLQHAQGVDK
jgi:anti-anti-sigma factor